MTVTPVLGFKRAARQYARCFYIVAALVLSLFFSISIQADQPQAPEYQIKSVFLYNFANFVQWPPQSFAAADSPLIIGVIGHNPFGAYSKDLQAKSIGAHKIIIKQIDSVEDAADCLVLFIADRKRAPKIIAALPRKDVLTVTDEVDTDSFQSSGAVINLFTAPNRTVHFEINVDAARRADLKINSSLLNLAKIVRDGRA